MQAIALIARGPWHGVGEPARAHASSPSTLVLCSGRTQHLLGVSQEGWGEDLAHPESLFVGGLFLFCLCSSEAAWARCGFNQCLFSNCCWSKES